MEIYGTVIKVPNTFFWLLRVRGTQEIIKRFESEGEAFFVQISVIAITPYNFFKNSKTHTVYCVTLPKAYIPSRRNNDAFNF